MNVSEAFKSDVRRKQSMLRSRINRQPRLQARVPKDSSGLSRSMRHE